MFSSPFVSPINVPILGMNRYGDSGPREFAPGDFDTYWTLYNRGLDTLYNSPKLALTSGGVYTLEFGLEIEVNGVWTSSNGSVSAKDIIRVRATSSDAYYVDGVSGTVSFVLVIAGTDCTFTLINMIEPPSHLDEMTIDQIDAMIIDEIDATEI